jgi:hypothetical protein
MRAGNERPLLAVLVRAEQVVSDLVHADEHRRSCVNGSTPPLELGLCKVLLLPLMPPPGQPQQLHYLVVYHNMNHTNGGLAIKETFNP